MNQIEEKLEAWVSAFFEQHGSEAYCYHNLGHTRQVVAAVKEMAAHYHLSDDERLIVLAAAWFHDLGYFSGGSKDHEERSADIAGQFLQLHHAAPDVINQVKSCIMATRLPQTPHNLLESIVCDADLFHLGTDKFKSLDKKMYQEAVSVGKGRLAMSDWADDTIKLLKGHHYHTGYAEQKLGGKKEENIRLLLSEIDRTDDAQSALRKKENKKKKDKKKEIKPERGIDTMFRVTSTNNQRLSDMADNKANILLTVNSIILSVVIALLLRKLENNEHLAIPTFMLLLVCLLTMVIAILATRPRIPDGVFTDQQLREKNANLLFFGNFYRMDLDDYIGGMRQVMDDRTFLYDTLVRDVYYQGVALGRKYRLLRLAYNIFMFGLIASVLAYLIAIAMYGL